MLIIIVTVIVATSCGQSNTHDNSENRAKKEITPANIEYNKAESSSRSDETNVNFECINYDFSFPKERSDSLLAFLKRAKDPDSTNRLKWEQKFFCAFPDSFEGMQAIFGFDQDKGAAPLYDYPNGENVIQYFSALQSIPDSLYYDKYVKINIGGVWEADNIQGAFDFNRRLTENTESACKALSNFSESEIESVFRFIFDGPHPQNEYNQSIYKELKVIIATEDKRLADLLTRAYDKLMVEDDGHGH